MELPPGATGFGPSVSGGGRDGRAFVTACHDAARRTGATVTAVRWAGVTPDFDAVLLAYEHERVAVLRHALVGLIATVRATGDHVTQPLAFTDHPHLAEILGESGFQVMSTAELRQPVTSADLSQLTRDEHEQIRYWKPATIGELLFNYWD